MLTSQQAKAYAAISMDILYKLRTKITPEKLTEQMENCYDLYFPEEAEELYNNMIQNNRILNNNISGKANCYIVNAHNSTKVQLEVARKFCDNSLELGKIYITPPGENADKYYELIKDIRNKNMDILLMNIFTILGMSKRENDVIKRLCRENEIIFVEI